MRVLADREQLSHGRGQGELLGFPFGQQTLVKGFDSGVEPCGHERGHVQHAADIRSAAKRATLAGSLARIVLTATARVDYGNSNVVLLQLRDQQFLIAPRGLHHDERAYRRFDSPDEFGDDLLRGVVDRQSFIALRKRDVQFVFGDVDFDKHREKRLVIVAAEFSVFRLRI